MSLVALSDWGAAVQNPKRQAHLISAPKIGPAGTRYLANRNGIGTVPDWGPLRAEKI